MKIEDILKRVEQRAQERGLSIAAVSRRATDSPDTIRNWDRAVRRGDTFNPTTRTLQRVAQALDVSYAWLTTGVDAPDQPGLAEGDAELWSIAPARPGNATTWWRVTRPMPGFLLQEGDVLRVDLSARPVLGDLVLASVPDRAGTGRVTILRRVAPGWYISDDWRQMEADLPGTLSGVAREVRRTLREDAQDLLPPPALTVP